MKVNDFLLSFFTAILIFPTKTVRKKILNSFSFLYRLITTASSEDVYYESDGALELSLSIMTCTLVLKTDG